jgi:hypothetical protein
MVAAARQIAEQVAVIGVELQLETHDGLRYRRVYSVKD